MSKYHYSIIALGLMIPTLAHAIVYSAVSANLTCKASQSGDGLIVTSGRGCVTTDGVTDALCVDAATALNGQGYTVNGIAPPTSPITSLTPGNLSTKQIPCELALNLLTGVLAKNFCATAAEAFGITLVEGGEPTIIYGPSTVVSLPNNTIVNQYSGVCSNTIPGPD